ncbi:MAG: hypothetical protein ACRDNF_02665, partial [Streptosporangiaceae bacterium]
AAASSTTSVPQPAPQQAQTRPMSNIGAEAVWGVKNGKRFMHLIKGRVVGKYSLKEIKLARTERAYGCTEYISNVSKVNGNNPFTWVTQQTCNPGFGYQWMSTQMWRSSYRGPVGYSGWSSTPEQTVDFISRNWDIGCDYGQASTPITR